MSLLINGMDMPKQTEVQTDKGTLKLWTIRNWKVGQDVQFGAAKIPCDLSFNHDGTVHLSVLGRNYSLSEIPTPHGRLIDADLMGKLLEKSMNKYKDRSDYASELTTEAIRMFIDILEHMPTIIESEE